MVSIYVMERISIGASASLSVEYVEEVKKNAFKRLRLLLPAQAVQRAVHESRKRGKSTARMGQRTL